MICLISFISNIFLLISFVTCHLHSRGKEKGCKSNNAHGVCEWMLHAIPTDELQENDFWRFIFCFFVFLDKSAEGCDARALLRERGEAWRAEAAWMTRCCDVWCVDDRCASIESRSGVYMQQWPAQPGAYTLWATVCQVTWCVCVAWPWSCRFMHGSTKRHTLFFLSCTLACAYILVPCYISLAPCRVSRGDLRQSSVHMCRGVWCSVFFSARYFDRSCDAAFETSLKEKY